MFVLSPCAWLWWASCASSLLLASQKPCEWTLSSDHQTWSWKSTVVSWNAQVHTAGLQPGRSSPADRELCSLASGLVPLCKENLAREDKSSQGVPWGALEPSAHPFTHPVPSGPLEAVRKLSWGPRGEWETVRYGLPRPCCTNSRGGVTSPVCSVFETHRGKWTAIPIFQAFQGSESMSFSSSADCQTPAKPGW